MNFLTHLSLTILIGYMVASYLSGTYIIFLAGYPGIKDRLLIDKVFIWFMSPYITLIWLYNWIVFQLKQRKS
jgi:hypothetical protein